MATIDIEANLIAHLSANCPSFKKIENAFFIKDVPDLAIDIPALFVGELSEEADAPEMTNNSRQLVRTRVLLQIAAPQDQLIAVRNEVASALRGYQPTQYHWPCEKVKGETIDVKPNLRWWSEIWQTAINQN